MNYRKLGHSELKISEISFGCMSLENNYETARELIHGAIDKGVNYFDTADLYQKGENELMLGKALQGIRNDIIIGTKVGNQWRADGSGWNWNPTKQYIIQAVEESLKRLQTDYIDLYQLHGGTIEDPIDEVIDAFEILQKDGKIRYYGISSIRPNVIKEYVNRSKITSVMMQYSLLDRRPEEECLDLLRDNNIGVLTRGTIAKGLLAGKPPADYLNYSESEVKQVIDTVNKLCSNEILQCAIEYVLKNPAVSSAIIGVRNKKQLEESVITRNKLLLTKEKYDFLKTNIPAYMYSNHR
ncbi:aldo/keto reductase [Aquimarina sp. MMG016]|uniref:aldo/keto reductase n=1 Tax=Aquimarina sp. MMG016 TaxID=2822690 RepID=UPI001B3A2206|nr:aldo/keto reductase [Aquimarina sp. MMG016]MBQ4818957.1 aldo/keto reductase [Aquimarina sp. MMG016]